MFLLHNTTEARHPHKPIRIQSHRPKYLGQPPMPGAAVQFHLPEPILSMHIAQGHKQIVITRRMDMRYAPPAAQDLDGIVQTWQLERSGHTRQWMPYCCSCACARQPPCRQAGRSASYETVALTLAPAVDHRCFPDALCENIWCYCSVPV